MDPHGQPGVWSSLDTLDTPAIGWLVIAVTGLGHDQLPMSNVVSNGVTSVLKFHLSLTRRV
jgi:hypothetical protein